MENETTAVEPRTRPGIAPEPKEAEVVRLMLELYRNGWGLTRIARELERRGIPAPEGGARWHPSIIHKILRRPVNAGLIYHEGHHIKGAHFDKRLIEPEEFFEILEEMGRRKRFPPRTLSCPEAPLGKLAACDECGTRMYVTNRVQYRAYRCEGPTRFGVACASRPYVRADHLESRIVREIEKIAGHPEVIAAAEREARRLLEEHHGLEPEQIGRLEAELADIERKWVRLAERHADGRVSDDLLEIYDRQLRSRKAEVQHRLEDAANREADKDVFERQTRRALRLLQDFPALWSEMEPEEKRGLLQTVVESLRIGRAEGRVRVKLKLRLMDETVFDLPVSTQWQRARKGVEKPPIFPRQLAYLALAADGNTDAQIAARWQVRSATVRRNKHAAIAGMRASTVEEAIAKLGPALAEWKPLLPLDGRHGKPKHDPSVLTQNEMELMRFVASGMGSPEIAAELGLPVTTICGRLNQIRRKLGVNCREAAVAKALSLSLLGPSDRSPALLLRAYERLVDPRFRLRVNEHRLRPPTPKQIECLRCLVEGLSAGETARRMGVGEQAIVFLRMRVWKVVGGTSLSSALEKSEQLGILSWAPSQDGADENDKGATEVRQSRHGSARRSSESSCPPSTDLPEKSSSQSRSPANAAEACRDSGWYLGGRLTKKGTDTKYGNEAETR